MCVFVCACVCVVVCVCVFVRWTSISRGRRESFRPGHSTVKQSGLSVKGAHYASAEGRCIVGIVVALLASEGDSRLGAGTLRATLLHT